MRLLVVYDSHWDDNRMCCRSRVSYKQFGEAEAAVVVRTLNRIADWVMAREGGDHNGMTEQGTVLGIHIRCASVAQVKGLAIRIHFAWEELGKEHESHSHVFEE